MSQTQTPQLWTSEGWTTDVAVATFPADTWIIPGIANLHSHAF